MYFDTKTVKTLWKKQEAVVIWQFKSSTYQPLEFRFYKIIVWD